MRKRALPPPPAMPGDILRMAKRLLDDQTRKGVRKYGITLDEQDPYWYENYSWAEMAAQESADHLAYTLKLAHAWRAMAAENALLRRQLAERERDLREIRRKLRESELVLR